MTYIDPIFFTTMFIRHTCYFLSLSLVILQKTIFCTVLLYRKFSYLVHIYIFTLAIILYHFLPQCLSVTRETF